MAASWSSFQRGERRGRWGSPERTVVWTEPKPTPRPAARKVAVVYYLCHRDGHLDHPHFLEMELPRSVPGLHLRDFTARLATLRGAAMAGMYSWSAKRSYRNGYVWQDLTDDDLVHPAHGADEYVLKGSPLLLLFPQLSSPQQDADKREGRRHCKNWRSFDDLGDCNNKLVVAAQQSAAATQTDADHHGGAAYRNADDASTELAIHEISPPPCSSSPDDDAPEREAVGVIAGGRMRASAVLMQIFSCGGSMPTTAAVKPGRGHARTRSDLAMASASNRLAAAVSKEVDDVYASAGADEWSSVSGGSGAVERDYFSGSLVVESSKKRGGGGDGAVLLKRSSSCNAADRGGAAKLKLPVAVPATKEVRAGCLASRGSRAPKRNTAAQSRDGGECKGATADGHRPGGRGSSLR